MSWFLMIDSFPKICTVLVLALAFLSAGAMAAAPISTIGQGNTVFLGEEGLDITAALNGAYYGQACGASVDYANLTGIPHLTQIGWWASAADISSTSPSRTIDTGSRYTSMMIAPSDFVGYTGNWYLLGANGRAWSPPVPGCGCSASGCNAALVFTVQDQNLDIRIEDATLGYDATDGWIPLDDEVRFRISTNLYQITQRSGVSAVPIRIYVRSPDGATLSALTNKAGTTTSLLDIPVTTTPYTTGPIWDTGIRESYPPGTYTIWAECNVNSMKDNYDVIGKTVSSNAGMLSQESNPLIVANTRTTALTTVATSAPTTVKTTVSTTVVTTVQPTATTPAAELTTLTVPPTGSPTVPATAAPTKSPGFTSALAGCALLLALVWSGRKE
jgi:hypothetical protein